MEELNNTVNLVKSLQSKISLMEIDNDSRPSRASRRILTKKFTYVKTNTTLVDEHISKLQSSLDKSKGEIDEFHKKTLYLEAYSLFVIQSFLLRGFFHTKTQQLQQLQIT